MGRSCSMHNTFLHHDARARHMQRGKAKYENGDLYIINADAVDDMNQRVQTTFVTDGGVLQEVRPLLQATPLEGAAASYEVVVTGQDAMEVRLARVLNARSRYVYVATIRSDIGSEDREFQARENTRVIELGVAHHYYFLRDVREGRETPVLEPRSRRQIKLTAGSRTEEELVLGPNHISARRVEYTSDSGDDRVVWYDRQGRVLRVEVPSLSYVAERTDLVG